MQYVVAYVAIGNKVFYVNPVDGSHILFITVHATPAATATEEQAKMLAGMFNNIFNNTEHI